MIFESDDLPFGFFGESSWGPLEVSLRLFKPDTNHRAMGFTKEVPPEEFKAHEVNRVRAWRAQLTEAQKARRREQDRLRWHRNGKAAKRRARKASLGT